MRISDNCSRHVVCADASDTIRDAARSMRHHHVGCLVVVRNEESGRIPCGIITDRDIVLSIVAADVDADSLTVGDVMSGEVAVCHLEETLLDAISIMRRHGVRRLPVLDTRGTLAGIITVDDVYGALGDHLRLLSDALSREQSEEIRVRA